jgi:hypothetical protein
MEPLQEWASEVIVQEEEEKNNMVQTQAECAKMINEEITMQVLDALRGKTVQPWRQENELIEKL